MRTSKYWVKRVGSEEEGDGLRKAVVHLSAALKIMFLLPTPQKCDLSFLALKQLMAGIVKHGCPVWNASPASTG